MEPVRSASDALDSVRKIISKEPTPVAGTEAARFSAQAIGLHLAMLILVASDANVSGRHSCALALFRAMEDALDCFAAVSLMPNAAERWMKGELKASAAARLWEHRIANVKLATGEKAVEYRKRLRSFFNNFAHCSPCLTDWNLYPEFDSRDLLESTGKGLEAKLKLNHEETTLEQNAIRIGAYLAAHTLEFVHVVEMAYEEFLAQNEELRRQLRDSAEEIGNLFEKETGPVYLGDTPPELEEPIVKHPRDPNLVMRPKLLRNTSKGQTRPDTKI